MKPTYAKIFGQKYKIRYTHDEEDSYGVTDPAINEINIRPSLPADKEICVLAHELTHAVVFETPLCDRKRLDIEEVCDLVGYHMIDMLKNNPHILEFLLRDVDAPALKVVNEQAGS